MTRRSMFLVAAIVLFLLAALSAFMDSVNLNEMGFVALGLVSFAAAHLPGEGVRL